MTKSTWKKAAATSDWNTAENWSEGTPVETAKFGYSSQTSISFSNSLSAEVQTIEFSEDSAVFALMFSSKNNPGLTITGKGVRNYSTKLQSFIVAATTVGYQSPQLKFTNSANAGDDNVFYCAGPEQTKGYGGGVISFCNTSSAGSAFFKVWTGAGIPPRDKSTVGGEVSFSDSSSADNARFTIYGSLGTDGDTFGNVVFHDTATADNATLTNIGGTVAGGDGGNTQFYNRSSAANAVFENFGGSYSVVSAKGESKATATAGSNGGDVAFDGSATGANGYFHNYAASGKGSYGGVTSFNNNWPHTADKATSAGNGHYFNYGANGVQQGGGGHVSFSAKFGSPTAENGCFVNYGSSNSGSSSAGHTAFTVTSPNKDAGKVYNYFPTAGKGTFFNHPAPCDTGVAGYTQFAVYAPYSDNKSSADSKSSEDSASVNIQSPVPTAGESTITNLGANIEKAAGGYTQFKNTSTAANSTLLACGGTNQGYGGKISFYDDACGGTATVKLYDNGELDLSYHNGGLSIGSLILMGGIISAQLSPTNSAPIITVSDKVEIGSKGVDFTFSKQENRAFSLNTEYKLIKSLDLSEFNIDQFRGNSIDGAKPIFSIVGDELRVQFVQSA